MLHSSGHEYDLTELDERFTPFYESGQRVEVEWLDGFEDYSGYSQYMTMAERLPTATQ